MILMGMDGRVDVLLAGDSAEILTARWRKSMENPCRIPVASLSQILVSRSAKKSQNSPKGEGVEDERLREIAGQLTFTP
jgi:hypothetical protein